MPQIQLLSDLHLEVERGDQPLYVFDFPKCAPNLALLGDIGWTRDERLFTWLEEQLHRFERVFFVSGNHEPYVATLAESRALLDSFATKSTEARKTDPSKGEFIFLNRTAYHLGPDTVVLGCTLWTALNPDDLDILKWSLTDFRRIDGFTPDAYNAAHKTDLAWLRDTIAQLRSEQEFKAPHGGPLKKVVVFTHHAPTVAGTGDPKYLSGPTNSAFASELAGEAWWGPPVAVWAFGHTHWSCDFVRRGVRVVSNQRGYGGGGVGFDVGKVIDV